MYPGVIIGGALFQHPIFAIQRPKLEKKSFFQQEGFQRWGARQRRQRGVAIDDFWFQLVRDLCQYLLATQLMHNNKQSILSGMKKKASRQPHEFIFISKAESKVEFTAVVKEGGGQSLLDHHFPDYVKIPLLPNKPYVPETYHDKVRHWYFPFSQQWGWFALVTLTRSTSLCLLLLPHLKLRLSRQSQQDLQEVFTISDPSQVRKLMRKVQEVRQELSEIMEARCFGNIWKMAMLQPSKDAFENFKIAWTSSPVLYAEPAWAAKWLRTTFRTENFYFPSERACNQLETEQDIEALRGPFIHFFHCVLQLSHLLAVYLRKSIARRCESAQVPSELARISKMKEYADKTSYLSKRSMNDAFHMPLSTALRGDHQKAIKNGQDLEESYFAYQESEAKKLMENLEKVAPVKLSKRAKRNFKKAEQAKKKKEELVSVPNSAPVQINPEESQSTVSIVDSDAYKISEHQKGSITPADAGQQSISANPVDMFIDYFVPPQKQQNQRKGSNSTSSENIHDPECKSFAPAAHQKRKQGQNGKKRYEEKSSNNYERDSQQAAFNLVSKMLEGKLYNLENENKEVWQLKNASYHRLLAYFGVRLPYFSVDIFGSLASGVSLPNSDIDILLSPRVAVQIDEYFLSDLAHELSLFGWVTHCDAILTAKIPVIKLIVDPFVCATNPESQFRHYSHEQQLSTPFLIKFDITLNTAGANNSGLVSSSYMQNVFRLRPRLVEAMLVVKHLLERAGLNEGYKGGISSYNIFIMLICFAEHSQFNFEAPLADFLTKFLHFYTQEFDYQKSVLRYEPGQSCVLSFAEYCGLAGSESLGSSGVVKMIDPINGRLVRASFSRFEEVVDLFRQLADAFREVGEEARLAARPLMGKGNRKSWEVVSSIETAITASPNAARLAALLRLG